MSTNNSKTSLSENLKSQSMSYLGLTKQPFANEILSDKTFFSFPALNKISESLCHQVQFSDLLLLIEGPQGSGKSTLFRHFIQLEINNTKLLPIQAEATDTLPQLQEKMSLHLQDLGEASNLDENLKSLKMFNQTPLLIIDNSHVLNDTTLQQLLRYQQQLKQKSEVTLKILLFANSGMSQTIQAISQIEMQQMYVQHMPEYSATQVEGFINHKLQLAGYTGEAILSKQDLEQLIKGSQATPASIQLNAAAIIDRIIEKNTKPNLPRSKKITLGFGIAVILIIALLISYHFIYQQGSNLKPAKVSSPQAIMGLDVSTSSEANTTQAPLNIAATESPIIEAAASSQLEQRPKASTKQAPPIESETDAASNHSAEPLTANTSIPLPVKSIAAAEQSKPVEMPEPHKTLPITTAPQKPLTTSTEPPHTEAAPIPTKAKAHVTQAKKPAPDLAPALIQLNKRQLHDAAYLKQLPASYWTIQLIGAHDANTLLKFAQHHQLTSNAAWYKTWLKGNAYYVLVYGEFTRRDDARNEIAKLPEALRALKPWIKSIKSVQKAIGH